MVALYLGVFGLLAFVVGVGILGLRLRRFPFKENAEKYSRIAHFLFFAGLVTPGMIWLFYPGLTHLDELVGLDPLPLRLLFLIIGVLIALPGLYLLSTTNKALRDFGSGANAFRLTKRIVEKDIYQYSRNPMSLGYYLFSLSVGFISGSTFPTLGVAFGLVPAHIFFLKYFEELELELRFEEPYQAYKQKTPFLAPRFWQSS